MANPKAVNSSRPPKTYARTVVDEITSVENRSVLTAVAVFVVRLLPRLPPFSGAHAGTIGFGEEFELTATELGGRSARRFCIVA
jgi:hypothetical protein